MRTYSFHVYGTTGTPTWMHETYLLNDADARRYGERLVKDDFFDVRWFMALHIVEERGEEEGRHVASLTLAQPQVIARNPEGGML